MAQSLQIVHTLRLPGPRGMRDGHLLLRGGVVAATLVGSALLAPNPSLLVAGGLAGLMGLLACVRWPSLGLAALVLGALVVPVQISTGTQTALNIAILLTALLTVLWVLEMLVRRDLHLVSSGAIAPALVFGFACVLSFIVGLQVWQPFATTAPLPSQLGGVATYLLSLAAFLLVAHRVRDLRVLQGLTWVYLAWGAVYILQRLRGVLQAPDQALSASSATLTTATATATTAPTAATAATSWWHLKGADYSVFWTWVVALAFSQAVFNARLARGWRLLLLLLSAATLFVGFRNLSWNSGWLPPLVAVIVMLWLGAPRAALPLSMLALAAVLVKFADLYGVLFGAKNQYDLLTRTAAWSILWDIIRLNPVLGTGFANYYWYTPLYPILGYSVSFNSHNNYIDLLAQTGVVGFACFAWLVLAIARVGWRLRTLAPVGFARAYVYGALGGLAGMLVSGVLGDWILPFVYNIGLIGFRSSVHGWLFLGGLVAVEQIVLATPAPKRLEPVDERRT